MVDSTEAAALNSNGKPIHWSEGRVRNFWRWFGSRRAVDARRRVVGDVSRDEWSHCFDPYWKKLGRDATPSELKRNEHCQVKLQEDQKRCAPTGSLRPETDDRGIRDRLRGWRDWIIAVH